MKNVALIAEVPPFVRTPHLPEAPAATPDDRIAPESEMETSLALGTLSAEEKIDGANIRIRSDGESEPIVGNHDHILHKGYIKKETPAKLQFRALWGYVYEHRKEFRSLAKSLNYIPILYAEWLYAQHTIPYDQLPTLIMPFDLLVEGKFLDPAVTRELVLSAGFVPPPLLEASIDRAHLLRLTSECSAYSSCERREGVYLKVGNGEHTVARFKFVRPDFKPRTDFNTSPLIRNRLVK